MMMPAEREGLSPELRSAFQLAPAQSPSVVVIRRPDRLLQKLEQELEPLGPVLPGLRLDVLAALSLDATGLDLTRAEGLRAAGLNPEARMIVIPGLGDAPVLLMLAVADRSKLAAWAEHLAEGRSKRLELGGEHGWVLFPASESPLACLLRGDQAYCQLGVSPGADPMAALRRWLESRSAPPREGPTRAITALPNDSDVVMWVQPAPLAAALSDAWLAQAAQRHRFDPEPIRQTALRDARARAAQLKNNARTLEGVAMGFAIRDSAVALHTVLALDDRGARALDGAMVKPGDDTIARWSETPAIARLLVRLRPHVLRSLLEPLGVSLPEESLSGSLAALALGLDTDCPAAKANAQKTQSPVMFALPLAAAVGLNRPLDPRAMFGRTLPEWMSAEAPAGDASMLHGEAFGSPLELRVNGPVLLIGTGPGGGAAAARRWSDLGPPREGPAEGEPPFFEAGLDLVTASAAITASALGEDSRPELLSLERIHRRLRPLLQRYRTLSAKMVREDHGRRLRVTLEAIR
jgi:hypothetical protein